MHDVAREMNLSETAFLTPRADGFDLRWKQIGVLDLMADPQLPYFLQWEVEHDQRPGAGVRSASLTNGQNRSTAPSSAALGGVVTKRWTLGSICRNVSARARTAFNCAGGGSSAV